MTKERILECGARLIHAKGFNNTGIQEILDAAGVPKGSFYFYFKNKEDFGVQVVDFHGRYFAAVIEERLLRSDKPPLRRLYDFFESFRRFYCENGFTCGCPVGNLIQEMSDLSPAFRERLGQAFEGMIAVVADQLLQAVDGGDLPTNSDPEETAAFIITAWQGALMRMKLQKSDRPLISFRRMVFERLLGFTEPAAAAVHSRD